ncbi:MAG: 50S ribosomal protein L3 [Spirochaetales bacterium]|nr:50S ribosomal protein L3 [Spirochaetales bacterium]
MVGLIGKKIGMTQVFDESGNIIPVTVVAVPQNVVIGERNTEKNGYDAVILGAFEQKESRVIKPVKGQFKDGLTPQKVMIEIRDFEKEYEIGKALTVDVFQGIDFIDVRGVTKGKGYQGVMKRHGFSGGRKTHGSKFHRAQGSTGSSSFPSRVFKGLKMAGRMGGAAMKVQNLRLVKIDTEKNTLLIKGAIPGPKNATVVILKAKKKGHITVKKSSEENN